MIKSVLSLARAAVCTGIVLSSIELAHGSPLIGPSRQHMIVNIGSDRGGYVGKYALRMLRLKQSGIPVKFSGRCQSACTIYLALSRNQTCVSPGSSFGFHAPYGGGKKGNRIATSYILNSYPSWVRSWLRSRGGLSTQLVTMDYAYASKYMRKCGATA